MEVSERAPHVILIFICKDVSQSYQGAFPLKSHSSHAPSNKAFKSKGYNLGRHVFLLLTYDNFWCKNNCNISALQETLSNIKNSVHDAFKNTTSDL